MNEHDSERMKGMLESLGYEEAGSRGDAELILFNTCSIREKADNRLVGHLGEAKRLKRLPGQMRIWSLLSFITPKKVREQQQKGLSGVVLMERA